MNNERQVRSVLRSVTHTSDSLAIISRWSGLRLEQVMQLAKGVGR